MHSESTNFFQKYYRRPFFYWWTQRKIFKHLSQRIPVSHKEGDLILSVGFYDSSELFTLRKTLPKCRIVGIDFLKEKVTSTSLELKPYSSHFSVFSCDLNQIEFEPYYFSGIFALNSIYFCVNYETYFKTLRRNLKKNGYIFLQVDLKRMSHLYEQHKVRFLKTTPEILENSLSLAGFKNIQHFKLPFLNQDDFLLAY